jgi:hypothetical protein
MPGLQRKAPMKRGSGLARGNSQLKSKGFKSPDIVNKVRAKKKPAPLIPVPEGRRNSAKLSRVDCAVRAAPKTVELRNGPLLAMAEKRDCLLRVPGVCSFDVLTTVACHSNQGVHGKAGARKADDHYSVWGCWACHAWLDQDGIEYEIRVERFAAAMLLQIEQWQIVAASLTESESNRRAARWALFQHGVAV